MKKNIIKFLVLLLLIFPTSVFAYSNKIIPGGKNIGIKIEYDGILVIGFYEINNKLNNETLKVGDYIIKVGNNNVSSIEELIKYINEEAKDNKVELTIKRKNKEMKVTLPLVKENDSYKTGLYVKDKISGIGTISYIDPESNIYGALGHEIIDSKTNDEVEVKTGAIYDSYITSIDRSTNGNPGSKIASIDTNNALGTINKNTKKGIYGTYDNITGDTLEIKEPNEIKKGEAKILTTLDENVIKEYKINITKIDKNNQTKNLYFEIIDEELLNKTGGIVQGMSGSPIIQDNKIIGAVTHVVIDNVKKGYGIFITTMLEAGEEEE